MSDLLVEIKRKDWHFLRNLYHQNSDEHYIAYTTIENCIRVVEQDPNVKHINLFCLNGDFNDGSFVMIDWRTVYTDTLNKSPENLFRLLRLFDFSNGFTFLNLRPEIGDIVVKVLQDAKVETVNNDSTLLYRLPKEDALNLDVKVAEGIELRQITESKDVEKVNTFWPTHTLNSLCEFKRTVKHYPSVGAYKDGVLVSWIIRYPNGLLGALQTDDKYYGFGYASLVTRYLSKIIAELGYDVYADIYEQNKPSRSLFEKLGFKAVGKVQWIRTKITTPSTDE